MGSAQLIYFVGVGIVCAARGRESNSLDWVAGDNHNNNTGGRGMSAVAYSGGLDIVCAAGICFGGVGLIAYRAAGQSAHLWGAWDILRV